MPHVSRSRGDAFGAFAGQRVAFALRPRPAWLLCNGDALRVVVGAFVWRGGFNLRCRGVLLFSKLRNLLDLFPSRDTLGVVVAFL